MSAAPWTPTEDEIVAFEADGAVVVRGLFDIGWIEMLRVGVERNLDDRGPGANDYTAEGGSGAFYDDYRNWERIDEYRDFVENSPAAALVASFLRSNTIRFFHEHILIKEPGTTERTPWHHDQPYYPVNGDQVCSIWLPLDLVPETTCPRFVAGSHLWPGYLTPRTFAEHRSYTHIDGYAPVPDIDAELAADPDAHRLLTWDLQLGDCVVFHMKSVHDAPGTEGLTTRRRAFSTRWLGDDAVWAERPFTTSPPFADIHLTPGEPLDHARFPQIWPERPKALDLRGMGWEGDLARMRADRIDEGPDPAS